MIEVVNDCPNIAIVIDVPIATRGQVSRMVSYWCSRWWWALVLVLLVPLCLSAEDPRFLYVAGIVALMIYPTVLWIVYAAYGARSEARFALCAKHIEVTHDGDMRITYLNYPPTAGDDDTTEPKDETPETQALEIVGSKVVAKDQVTSCAFSSKGLVIEWGSGVWDYVTIPSASLPDKELTQRLISLIAE